MKSLVVMVVSLMTFFGYAATIEIQEALRLGKITVATSYLKLGEKGLQITLKNKENEPLSIQIPRGTTFHPNNDDEQILMNVEPQLLALAPNQSCKSVIDAYCIQLENHAPSLSTSFSVNKVKDKKLVDFLGFLEKNKVSKENYQVALWALTDASPIADISSITKEDMLMRDWIAKTTNRVNPWYDTGNRIDAEPGRPIRRTPVSVKGELKLFLKEDTTFELLVLDDEKKEMMRFPRNPFVQKNSDYTFRFNVQVEGWRVGTYKVVLRNVKDKSEISVFNFEV
jgi:hypothetical protein